jgi:NAD(P)-dependent dehydrogenase (short-subunit alcohol dehydrogenase family)
MTDASDRVALVTGAGTGIGRDVALALADDGWRVAILGRRRGVLDMTLAEIRTRGVAAMAVTSDVRDPDAIASAVHDVEEQLGAVQALINNAGVQRLSPAVDVTESDWDAVLDTNLKGAFFCAQAVGRGMVSRGTGTIVNVASAAALIAVEDRAAYAASKAGLVMLTRVLALEWAASGVRVNAIAPTFVETELARQTLDQPGMRNQITARIPMGRLAATADVVGAVRFLLDDAASGFVTGQVVAIDGGLSLR